MPDPAEPSPQIEPTAPPEEPQTTPGPEIPATTPAEIPNTNPAPPAGPQPSA